MPAYNLNCWLMLFNREPQADATALKHTTLATVRLRFLFVAAKIWRHAGRTGVSYSGHYEEKSLFERLMGRLRGIAPHAGGYAPVMIPALCRTTFAPVLAPRIRIYAQTAIAAEQMTSTRDLAGADSREAVD